MTPAERRRRDEEAFFVLVRETGKQLHDLVLAYLLGDASLSDLSESLVAALRDAHSRAGYLGRRLAGTTVPFGFADEVLGASVVISEMTFLHRLLTDLQTGRYTITSDGADVHTEFIGVLANRVAMYADRLRGTANEAWGTHLPAGTMVEWVLGMKEHCRPTPGWFNCPDLAAGGPYPSEHMPTWPGLCQTPCLTNCDCDCVTTDGDRGMPMGPDEE